MTRRMRNGVRVSRNFLCGGVAWGARFRANRILTSRLAVTGQIILNIYTTLCALHSNLLFLWLFCPIITPAQDALLQRLCFKKKGLDTKPFMPPYAVISVKGDGLKCPARQASGPITRGLATRRSAYYQSQINRGRAMAGAGRRPHQIALFIANICKDGHCPRKIPNGSLAFYFEPPIQYRVGRNRDWICPQLPNRKRYWWRNRNRKLCGKIDKGIRIRKKSETGTEIENGVRVGNECEEGIKVKSAIEIGIQKRDRDWNKKNYRYERRKTIFYVYVGEGASHLQESAEQRLPG
ncbi:hypothetical protein EVAR_49258_1 [Eumeta japonica]|uniref:Uncharacterized protein n=1 Tax=Eumeta variegata TaxID=151549 RepID=A0A4C1YKY3_EUMVA|nr:hypothetical protein EVAR_49258_1 [Eumeta japonica]